MNIVKNLAIFFLSLIGIGVLFNFDKGGQITALVKEYTPERSILFTLILVACAFTRSVYIRIKQSEKEREETRNWFLLMIFVCVIALLSIAFL